MGYVLFPLTILVDILAGYASYYYGASVLPYLWAFLSKWAGPEALYLIEWPVSHWVHRVAPAGPPSFVPYFQHPPQPHLGQIWVGIFLFSHLYYAVKHLYWRYNSTHLGTPHRGNPGEDRWEIVQRRWHDSLESLDRFYHKVPIQMPLNWRYTVEPFAPIVQLRGRQLLIREDALHASAVRQLSPELARQLASYNSHDWLFSDFLGYYPQGVMFLHILLGIGIWIPTLLTVTAWPLFHWRRRVMAYDRLAWMCGQAQPLYDILAASPLGHEERPFFSPYPLTHARLGQLEALIRTEHKWMQEHQLVDKSEEPPILHGSASEQSVPLQLEESQLPPRRSRPQPKG